MNNHSVLSCIDGSTFTEAVCEYSSWIANSMDAPLKFLHTVEQSSVPAVTNLSGAIGLGASEDLLNELAAVEQTRSGLLVKKGNLMLQAAKKKADAAGVKTIELRQQKGGLAESLIEMEEQIRVLVIGIRGTAHESGKSGLGAQLETVIRSLHKPTLVVNREFSTPKKIMLAYDGSKGSQKALNMAASSPLFKAIPCHLVYVGNETTSADKLLEDAAKVLTTAGIETTIARLSGKADDCLAAYQAE
ncbi:MAG: universal stress protein [Pseudomonadales bacterium]|nr:universal stress protein [Pseudomonadales bacterium]